MNHILFVYNADSGLFSTVTDFAHKILRPETYSCGLCKLTYGAFAMHKQWREFIASLPLPVSFLHRDQFRSAYPACSAVRLPAIFTVESRAPQILISAQEIERQRDLSALMALIQSRLALGSRASEP